MLPNLRPISEPRSAASGGWYGRDLRSLRGLVTSLIEQPGCRVAEAQRIPHDLWAAGSLPELAFAERLTVLLIGFDLTFEMQPRSRTISIVPLPSGFVAPVRRDDPRSNSPRNRPTQPPQNTRQVYSLRVAEKPVGAVLQELADRLNWKFDIDRPAILAAGKSLDARVSFTVENADQDDLLEALLQPAGLDFRRDGERIKIVPRRRQRMTRCCNRCYDATSRSSCSRMAVSILPRNIIAENGKSPARLSSFSATVIPPSNGIP